MHRILSCLSLVGVLACGGSPGSTETAKPIADPVAPTATCPDMTAAVNSMDPNRTEDDGRTTFTATQLRTVAVGKIESADLDGDGSDEIFERIDEYIAGPEVVTEVLRVYSVRGDKLELVFSAVLSHSEDEDEESISRVCRASHTVGKNSITFDVTEPKPDDDDDDDSEVPMWATGEPGRGAVECLPIGRYRLTLVDGAAKLSRRK